jgi:hypothetical protein
MSMAVGRRVAVGIVCGLLGVALLVAAAPGNPGAIRLAGVGVLWWLAAAAGVVAASTASIFLRPPPPITIIAAWAAPAVLVSLAAHVFSGAAGTPVLVLAVLAAPLVALLRSGSGGEASPNPVASLALLASAWLVLWATLLTLADVARVLGVRRWLALALAMALALLATAWRTRGGGSALRASLGAGAVGFVLPVIAVGVSVALPPWAAWSEIASRPALTFGPRSAWVTDGRHLAEPATFAFTEAHRVTALAPGVYRVVEEEARRRVTREWRLAAGDVLTMRPGDRLVLEADARVRFEAGKRVPGVPVSGVAWADPPERRLPQAPAHALGVALTLLGGALAFTPAAPSAARAVARGARAGPALLLLLVLAAACWGVYGAHAAPELAVGGSVSAGLVELPALLVPTLGGRALVATGVVALMFLFVAAACALREIAVAGSPIGLAGRPDAFWTGALVLAAAASVWPWDAWRAFLAGCGLAGAAVVAPRLAGGGGRAGLAGALVGVAAFAALTAGSGVLPAWAAVAGAYPLLLAGPLAWVAARVWRVAAARRD